MAAQSKLELLLELKNRLSAGFGKAKQFVDSNMKDLKDKVSQFTGANSQAFKAIQDEVPGAARAIGLLKNPYVLAAAAAVGFALATTKAVGMAMDWETGMAKVNVTAQLSRGQLDLLGKKLLWIGAHGSTPIEQIPEAFNTIISAVGDVDKSLEILGPTLKAAKAGFTDVKTVANAATGAMASSGENINTVYDVLFATLNKGKAEFVDIANYLPKIIPGAKNAGFSLQEVGGAFAFLTAKGQTAEYTTTGLMNTFKAFSKPETIKGLKSIGVDIFDANRNTKPFLQIMKELSGVLGKTTNKEAFIKQFSAIGFDQDAVAAVGSMVQDMKSLEETMGFVKNSQGQLNEAVKNSRTSTEGWASGWNKIKMLAIEFGQLFLPLIDWAGQKFSGFMDKVLNGYLAVKMVGSGIAEFFKELWNVLQPIGQAMVSWSNPAMMAEALGRAKDAFGKLDLSGAFNRGAQHAYSAYVAEKKADSLIPPGLATPNAAGFDAATGGTSGSTVASATPNKSITINIEALHKGDLVLKQNNASGDGMSIDQLEKMMNEIYLRLLRNTSAAY
jgi:TP901 family phage tail tape measure protein